MPTPGVGYIPNPAVSVAGGGYYRMDLSAHPHDLSGAAQQVAMARRYGTSWPAGVAGIVHQPSIQQYLAQDFEAALATGAPPKWASAGWRAGDWTGVPTAEEVDDAYYSKDPRVTTRNVPRPPVPVEPPPAPAPPPQPQPAPSPVPGPALSPVAQRAAELEVMVLGTWPNDADLGRAAKSGLLRAVIKAALKVYRKHLGEPTS